MPVAPQVPVEVAVELQHEKGVLAPRDPGRGAAFKDQFLSGARRTAGPQLRQRPVLPEKPLQQHLHPPPAFLRPEQACRNDGGIVYDQQVTGFKQPEKVRELPVPQFTLGREVQQPAGAPALERPLRNQFRGRVVGKIFSRHARIVGNAPGGVVSRVRPSPKKLARVGLHRREREAGNG